MTGLPDGDYSCGSIVDQGRSRPTVTGTRLRVTIAAGRLTAHAGCNTMTGSYVIDDGRLSCGPMATTLMAGPDDVMSQERWVAQLLDAAPAVSVDPDTGAIVLAAGDDRAELLPESGSRAVPLGGTMWRVHEIRDLDGRIVVDRDTLARVRADVLVADPGGVMSVQTGCNLGQAAVTVHEGVLSIGPMRLTRRGCPPDAEPVERAMVAVLQGDVGATLTGGELELTGGGHVLVLHAEPPGTNVPGPASEPSRSSQGFHTPS